MKAERGDGCLFAFGGLALVGYLAFWAAVILVAVHFIAKWW